MTFQSSRIITGVFLCFLVAAGAGCDAVDDIIDQIRDHHGGGGGDGSNPCAATLCAVGTVCVAQPDGTATCEVPDGTPACGGIAGLACPGAGECVDDPRDSCDPSQGADCGGICACLALGTCVDGTVWDSSPGVCACAPRRSACATVRCAAGAVCVDQPDGTAACVVPPGTPRCGGIAGFDCPGMGECIDDPTDDCDPSRGGADCGGVCQCVVTVDCLDSMRFDATPGVCACVPVGTP